MNSGDYQELNRRLLLLVQSVSEACNHMTADVEKKISESLQDQRKDLTEWVQNDVRHSLSESLNYYSQEITESTKKLGRKVQELEESLNAISQKNKKLTTNAWLTSIVSLFLLIVGFFGLFWYYQGIIKENRIQAELLQKINKSDITVCGDYLCAAVSKNTQGKYRVIKSR